MRIALRLLLPLLLVAMPAQAMLKVGAAAPDFVLPAAQGGQSLTFDSARARAQGPLVLYFYPAAYTSGCSVEAKLFADAIDDFKAAGATVVGVSGDDIDKLKRFSVSHCRGRFPVAADAGLKTARAYDATGAFSVLGYASRVSYVISPEGRILLAHTDSGPASHIRETLAAVKRFQADRKR